MDASYDKFFFKISNFLKHKRHLTLFLKFSTLLLHSPFFWFRRILPLPCLPVHIIVILQSLWLVQSRLVGRVIHSWPALKKLTESSRPNLLNVVIYDNHILWNSTVSKLSFKLLQANPIQIGLTDLQRWNFLFSAYIRVSLLSSARFQLDFVNITTILVTNLARYQPYLTNSNLPAF